MPRFLNTSATNYFLEELIKNARDRLILISPYLKLNARIKELLEELDAELFWQIHRSTLVNVKAIAGVSRDLRGRQLVSVKGHPEKLEVSRSFTGLFKGM